MIQNSNASLAALLPTFGMRTASSLSWMTVAGYAVLACYVAIELAFYVYFHRVLVPRANQRLEANPYLDYPNVTDRHKLLVRILQRLQHQATAQGVPVSQVLTKFFVQWFGKVEEEERETTRVQTISSESTLSSSSSTSAVPSLMRSQSSNMTQSTSSTSSSTAVSATTDDSSSISSIEEEETSSSKSSSAAANAPPPAAFWSIPGIGKDQITEFLAWALFAKDDKQLTVAERHELTKCLDILRVSAGLVFPPLASSPYRPRRLSLEDVSPLHRPLLVYVCVEALRAAAGVVLRWAGFRRTNKHGPLPGWYRPGRRPQTNDDDTSTTTSSLPLIFFHGIAPAGLSFYLPMVLSLVSDGRPTLLVEQPSISGRLGTFGALSETEMMEAVEAMVAETIDTDPTTQSLPLLWGGHSFGSCPLTWMLRRPALRERAAGMLLLDPVTILLSEPAVMMNFLYTREISKIRMVAASELFTEYYLRRHFAWYNAEVWIKEDIAAHTQVTVALSECDEIVDAPAVAAHLQQQRQQQDDSSSASSVVRTIYWPAARHAHCVWKPAQWKQLQQALWQQEAAYHQQQEESRQSSS